MSAGSLRHAALTFVAVSAATAAGIAYIHRGQRLEREVRPSRGPARTRCAVPLLRGAAPSVCTACFANPDSHAAARARRACAQTLHAGVIRDQERLAAKRAQLGAERPRTQGP